MFPQKVISNEIAPNHTEQIGTGPLFRNSGHKIAPSFDKQHISKSIPKYKYYQLL